MLPGWPGPCRLGNIGANDEQVLIDRRNGVVGDHHVDLGDLFTGVGVESDQPASGREVDARRYGSVAGPVGDATSGGSSVRHVVGPQDLSGVGIEGKDAIAGGQIHDAVDDDRRRLRERTETRCRRSGGVRAKPELPGQFQIGDILRSDLLEGRESRSTEIAVVHRPVGPRASLRLQRYRHLKMHQRQQRGCGDKNKRLTKSA